MYEKKAIVVYTKKTPSGGGVFSVANIVIFNQFSFK
jgi:hypothetical protein